jgi:hypothetical protein
MSVFMGLKAHAPSDVEDLVSFVAEALIPFVIEAHASSV